MSSLTSLVLSTIVLLATTGAAKQATPTDSNGIYSFTPLDIDGKPANLSQYRGKVLLIVNTASRCGYTPQYEGLQGIYEKYRDAGLVVLGFPANNFKGQEPGTEQEIKQFCTLKYNVTFPMFSKISVTGPDKHPLYKYLTAKETNPNHGGEITWNFNKFLVDRQGRIVSRFDSKDRPQDAKVVQSIEKALAE